jgi:pyridoxamine 5'-phosphate oxidase
MTDLAPWRSPLAKALHLNRALPSARYFQLATIRPNGHPANRTVVFRGFVPETNQLTAITDQRSQKIQQIQVTPWAEICWYFPKSREQFRINGPLHIVGSQHSNPDWQKAHTRTWQNLSDAARSQFYSSPPGQPYNAGWSEPQVPIESEGPPTTFLLLVLEPRAVEHLGLRSQPHTFHYYQLNSQGLWQIERLMP